jgi:hypothetical protein
MENLVNIANDESLALLRFSDINLAYFVVIMIYEVLS